MSTDTTLAPCPWCGEVPDAALDVRGTAIECPSCGTRGPAGCDAADAVEAWQKRASGAPATSGESAWPKDAADVRRFIEAHCENVQYGRHGPAPHDDDRYTLTAHDLLTAIRWWTDQ